MENEASIERQILDYLASNPAAQDTLRGIVEWWLLKQKIMNSIAEVEMALTKLVAEKKVIAHQGSDGHVHYRKKNRRNGWLTGEETERTFKLELRTIIIERL